MPTDRPSSRTKAVRPQVDHGIYLRTYEVTRSLDRAEYKSLWERVLLKIGRGSPSAETETNPKGIAAPEFSSASPVLARLQSPLQRTETALVPAAILDPRSRPVVRPRPFSWVLLAVVAALTAGLTFALIHFAWPSGGANGSEARPRHAAARLTTSSESVPQLKAS